MITPAPTTMDLHTGATATTERYGRDGHTLVRSAAHMEALGWAFTHTPTQEAYRRSTGEDAAPVLERYRQWVKENVIGSA
ncbi:hypothetical protein HNQ66_001266 [Shinella fusca]|uniref:Uncharacterized protein n=1 Tax=Shinella fusca TaxID=544480 RepID=A0A7W8DTN4_9HYPH|nr:hypothetical protein [Shinella fusca]